MTYFDKARELYRVVGFKNPDKTLMYRRNGFTWEGHIVQLFQFTHVQQYRRNMLSVLQLSLPALKLTKFVG